MRICFFLLFFFSVVIGNGQSFQYPSVRKSGISANSFVPSGWHILDSAEGVLRPNGPNDLVLILQHTDSVSILNDDFGVEITVITQPRMLVVLFFDSASKIYRLAEQNNLFVLPHDSENVEDPYDNVTIKKRVVSLSFQYFALSGSWYATNTTYKFRYQNDAFFLIGADRFDMHRGTGEWEKRSYNFLTNQCKESSGDLENDRLKKRTRSFRSSSLKTWKTFEKPFTWEVESGYFL